MTGRLESISACRCARISFQMRRLVARSRRRPGDDLRARSGCERKMFLISGSERHAVVESDLGSQ